MIQIYHNPRCGKSRNCLAFIKESEKEFEVINYLDNVPTFDELKSLIQKLNFEPLALVRQKEKIWIENFKNKPMTNDEIIQAMVMYPILIERPIVIKGNKAIIGRDLDNVTDFL
ncbi:arsenate reductase (glutaredoxin) [Flavobacterium sp. XS2P12]|jgi:arsenate reductase|uniref:arsenate reductase (glutaredoxin) n=1 Tax=Flavobacterium melibiosi TaxID=3398734 RepID=UPI003A842396